jgi:hypothetical protein
LIHQYKVIGTDITPITVTWEGQSTLAASSSTVYLQVFNYNSGSWETVDSDSTAAANTDFILTGYIDTNVSNYYDVGNVVAFRIYQEGV